MSKTTFDLVLRDDVVTADAVVDMPFDEPRPVNDVDLLDGKIAKVRELAAVDVALYVTARKDRNYAPLARMAARGACGIKLSTYEYHPVRFPRFDTGEMHEIFREAARIGLPVAFHNEDQGLVDHFLKKVLDRGDRSPGAHDLVDQMEPVSRPPARRPRGGNLSARGEDFCRRRGAGAARVWAVRDAGANLCAVMLRESSAKSTSPWRRATTPPSS
jgi:hypothetical protein